MRARLLLAVIAFPAFTLPAQRPGGVAPSGAMIAATARNARVDGATARSASLDGKRLGLTPAYPSDVGLLERLRSGLFLGVLYTEAGAAAVASIPAGRLDPYLPYLTQMRGAWAAYAASEGKAYATTGAIEEPDTPPAWQPASNRWSGCWWLWVFTGMPFCR